MVMHTGIVSPLSRNVGQQGLTVLLPYVLWARFRLGVGSAEVW